MAQASISDKEEIRGRFEKIFNDLKSELTTLMHDSTSVQQPKARDRKAEESKTFKKELKRFQENVNKIPDTIHEKAKAQAGPPQAQQTSRENEAARAKGSLKPGNARQVKASTSTVPTQNPTRQSKPEGATKKAELRRVNVKAKSHKTEESSPDSSDQLPTRNVNEPQPTSTSTKRSDENQEVKENDSEVKNLRRTLQKMENDNTRRQREMEKKEQEIQDLNEELKKRNQEVKENDSEVKNLRRTLQKMENDNTRRQREMEKKEQEIQDLNEELKKRNQDVENQKQEIQDLKANLRKSNQDKNETDSIVNTLRQASQQMENDKTSDLKEIQGLKAILQKRNQEVEKQEEEHQYLIKELKKRQESLTTKDKTIGDIGEQLRRQESEYEKLEREHKRITAKLKEMTAEKDDWMKQFGKLASDKVQSSPDVTDLGDPNRALKLAEKYRDIYASTWTTTFMAQRKLKKFQEKDIVKNLLEILLGAFSYCEELAQAQESSLRNLLLHPIQEIGIQLKPIEIRSQQLQKMKELRKQWAVGAVEEVKQAYWNQERKKITEPQVTVQDDRKNLERSQSESRVEAYDKADLLKRMDESKEFYRKCVDVCWPMALHDPPLYLDVNVKRGDPCNRDLYTMVTDGDCVEALVWPPLLQGEGGGLLAQGVVEVKTV